MPYFPPEFFEPEVRSSYFISEKMKRFWAASIEVLYTVKSIAEKHGFTLYADFGTLLGIVRHGGFIPWDDDIDVSMLRSEYQQLMSILPKELPQGYIVYNHLGKNVPDAPKAFVANSTRIQTSPGFLKMYHGCPLITGIDIFPIDTVPDDDEMWETQKSLYNAVYDAAQSYDKYKDDGSIGEYLDQLEELLNVKINRSGDVKSELWKLSDRVASLFGPDEGSRLCYMADTITCGTNKLRDKSWYASTVYLDFENIQLAVPIGYHDLLKKTYGDYARILRGTSTHNYPVYRKLDPDNVLMENHYKTNTVVESGNPNIFTKGKVLFLIKEADKWKYFDDLYISEKANGNDVNVIALPYHYKNIQNTETDYISQANQLSMIVHTTDSASYDIETELPERVYIQDPFDSYSLSTETDPAFFTENIRPYTGEIVLVIPYDAKVQGKNDKMQKEMFRTYIDTPGCYLSDRIIVLNDTMKDLLSTFQYVSDKITVLPPNPADKKTRKNSKKNILFSDDISHFACHEDLFIDKYSSIIRLFEENTETLHIYWHISKASIEALGILPDTIRDTYLATIGELESADWCTLIEPGTPEDEAELINIIDAAYGAPGTIITKCMDKKIPVMIWNIEVT